MKTFNMQDVATITVPNPDFKYECGLVEPETEISDLERSSILLSMLDASADDVKTIEFQNKLESLWKFCIIGTYADLKHIYDEQINK